MPIKTFATSDVLTASDLNNGPFADAVSADVAAEESTTSATFGALTTAGPIVSGVQLNANQGCLIFLRALAINQTGGGGTLMSYQVTGASGTQAATTANAAWSRSTERNSINSVSWFVASSTGSHTFTSQYRAEVGGTLGAAFANRRMVVKKF